MASASEDAAEDESEDYDQIPPQQREKARKRDNHTCQLCPRKGPEAGGITPLQVHHKTYEPDDCDLHDLDNLITLCVHCHGWHHSRPTPETPPVKLTEEAGVELNAIDFEVIDLLHREGPLTLDEIQDGIKPDKTRPALKECLWRIMGIDTVVEDQHQLIDQDVDSGRWGLPYQIGSSERRLPTAIHDVVRRTIDSIIVDARDRSCDIKAISEVLDINSRTIKRITHRGRAYDFPLDRFTGPGRPPENGFELDHQTPMSTGSVGESQQHLDELSEDDEDTEADCTGEDNNTVSTDTGSDSDDNDTNGDLDDIKSVSATTGSDNLSSDPDVAELREAQTPEEKARDGSDVEDYETIDPNQPQINGSNREYLITASEYPEELRPTIQRLNITRIAKREQGQPNGFLNGDR